MRIIFYQEENRSIPALDFILSLPKRAQAKGMLWIERLQDLQPHELKRPLGDYLGDKIYELRWSSSDLQCRILFFYHKDGTAVLSHGFKKKTWKVPVGEMERGRKNRSLFYQDPHKHTFVLEIEN